MNDFLIPIKTTKTSRPNPLPLRQKLIVEESPETTLTSYEDCLERLRNEPSYDQLHMVMKFLVDNDPQIWLSGSPVIVKISHELITQIIPAWWSQLRTEQRSESVKKLLIQYLSNVVSLSTLVHRLRMLSPQCQSKSAKHDAIRISVKSCIEVLTEAMSSDDFMSMMYKQCLNSSISDSRRTMLWKEITSTVAGGRVLSIVAEAVTVLEEANEKINSWLFIGLEYASWLGRNISAFLAAHSDQDLALKNIGDFTARSLTFGYQDAIIDTLLTISISADRTSSTKIHKLIKALPKHKRRGVVLSVLNCLDARRFRSMNDCDSGMESRMSSLVGDCAAILAALLSDDDELCAYLSEICSQMEGTFLAKSIMIKRTALVVLAAKEELVPDVMEKLLNKFGDSLFIRHAPIVQQEAIAQMLLLASGYVHRKQPMLLFALAKSSVQTQGMSNRLKATSDRARWLGMIVGMTMSSLTDKEGNKLVFEDESLETDEAKWYRSLVHMNDRLGTIGPLIELPSTSRGKLAKSTIIAKKPKSASKASATARDVDVATITTTERRIIELDDDDEEHDEDIIPYAKPDSDPEDDDDDPTLVQRNKPKAPVYIRDLIVGLRDGENYDRHKISLETAQGLIRRKANFGKEVSDHAVEIASTLITMQDQFELETFSELRQEALTAIVIAQPRLVAPYLARSCFEGDFSLQQRATMLTALALGSRELAGFTEGDGPSKGQFPSKQLPDHLRAIYDDKYSKALTSISGQIEQAMVEPMALKAADQLSGPNALKVRTFSSRMEVEKRRKKIRPNELAKMVGESFFFPLVGAGWAQLQSRSGRSTSFSMHLMPMYVRTLAVILHASGPSTLSLPQMTSELWTLLLSLRASALNENDSRMLEALLFGFLTILDLNEDTQRLANEHARELVETQEWAKLVLDRYGAKSDEAGEKVRMLAAGVVVRCHEVVEKWQRLMLGDMMDL